MRSCTTTDNPVISRTLASAFERDPVMNWFQPDGALVEAYFADVFLHQYQPRGRAWMSEDGAVASLWLPPGVKAKDPSATYTARWAYSALRLRGPGFIWQAWYQKQMFSRQRPQDDWYLHAIGVHLSARGRGLGAQHLGEALHWIDRHQPGCVWLENSNERNMGLYQRFGFRVQTTHDLSPTGPRLWLMRREANNAPSER